MYSDCREFLLLSDHVVIVLEDFDGTADDKRGEGAGHIELLDGAATGIAFVRHGDDEVLFGVPEADPVALGFDEDLFVGWGKRGE